MHTLTSGGKGSAKKPWWLRGHGPQIKTPHGCVDRITDSLWKRPRRSCGCTGGLSKLVKDPQRLREATLVVPCTYFRASHYYVPNYAHRAESMFQKYGPTLRFAFWSALRFGEVVQVPRRDRSTEPPWAWVDMIRQIMTGLVICVADSCIHIQYERT